MEALTEAVSTPLNAIVIFCPLSIAFIKGFPVNDHEKDTGKWERTCKENPNGF
jgi:hypothetical protein